MRLVADRTQLASPHCQQQFTGRCDFVKSAVLFVAQEGALRCCESPAARMYDEFGNYSLFYFVGRVGFEPTPRLPGNGF